MNTKVQELIENQFNIEETLLLFDHPLEILLEASASIRENYFSNGFDLCSINNVKSGSCSEDCKFCSQSSHFETESPKYDLIKEDEILSQAQDMEGKGVHRYSLVSSGKDLSNKDLNELLPIYEKLKRKTDISLCASHGILNLSQAKLLKQAGVTRYHHNVESSESFYPEICTTHSYQDRLDTISACKTAGIQICSGGIWGLGETRRQRIEMLFTLKEAGVNSVPINILCPVPGTPMANNEPLSIDEILKTMAIYRIVLKNVEIRIGGGRIKLQDRLHEAYKAGINGILTGDYLTTTGFKVVDDLKMLTDLGYKY